MQTPSGHPVESTSAARVVVLVSGAGSNLAALLAAHDDAAYGARVVGVVSDKADAGGLDLAREAGVAAVVVAPGDFADRAAWNEAVAQAVDVFRPDLVVLAGFMRILGPAFVGRFAGRTLNTHPALLPSFPGAHGVRDALAYGVRVTGCTVHVVDDGVDTGRSSPRSRCRSRAATTSRRCTSASRWPSARCSSRPWGAWRARACASTAAGSCWAS